MPGFLRVAPEFPVADLRRSLEYYEGKLGFETVMTRSDGGYAIVERDGVAIHLFQADGHTPQSVHLFVDGLDELYGELRLRGAYVTQEIQRKPWGTRDFRIRDDFGNEIKFTEPQA